MSDNPKRSGREGTMKPGARHDIADRLIVSRRRTVAAQLRREGATWQQIADHATFPDTGEPCYPPGTSKAAVYMDVKRGLEEAARELAFETGELRELESQRLDNYLIKLHAGIEMGDPKSINAAVRITEVRARLYGLNEPEKHEVITVDALDAAARELAREIERRAASDARSGQQPAGDARP